MPHCWKSHVNAKRYAIAIEYENENNETTQLLYNMTVIANDAVYLPTNLEWYSVGGVSQYVHPDPYFST